MITTVDISSLSGTSPISIYICDVNFVYCEFIEIVTLPIPLPHTVNVPLAFQNLTEFVIKIIDSNGCITFSTIGCNITPTPTPTPTQTPTPTPTPLPIPTSSLTCKTTRFCGGIHATVPGTFKYTDCYNNPNIILTVSASTCVDRCVNGNFPVSLISGVGSFSFLGNTVCPTPLPLSPTVTFNQSNLCRVAGICSDNGLCQMRFFITCANYPVGSYLTLTASTVPGITLSLDNNQASNGQLLYTETSGTPGTINFTLQLRDYSGNIIATTSSTLTHYSYYPTIAFCGGLT